MFSHIIGKQRDSLRSLITRAFVAKSQRLRSLNDDDDDDNADYALMMTIVNYDSNNMMFAL